MRSAAIAFTGMAILTAAAPGSAATIVIYADPMTMERRTVVFEAAGPDRVFLCMLPPSVAGCQPIPIKPSRR